MNQLKEKSIDNFLAFVLSESYKINHDEDSLSDILYLITVESKNAQDKKIEGDYYIFKPLSLIRRAYELYMNDGDIKEVKSLIKRGIKMLKGRKDNFIISFSDMSRMIKNKIHSKNDEDYDFFLDHITYLNYAENESDENVGDDANNNSGSIVNIDHDLSSYIRENFMIDKMTDVSISKLADSIKRIVLPKVSNPSLLNDIIRECFIILQKNLGDMDKEKIEEFFLNRSSDYKYIALWARIRMAWVSKIKKMQSNKNNVKRGRKKKKKN
ncbi:MAG: hypothetical protein QXS19_06185 [Candidatus Methanomethylicia archaeon]